MVLVIGLIFSKRTESGKDFFLAGRSLGWAAIGFSLFASNISSATLIGLSGQAYRTGVSISNYEWMATLILVFMTIFFIPFFIRSKITTIPEFLELRYDRFCRRYVSFFSIFLNVIVDTAASLFAGALVLQLFFPSLVIWQTCFVIAFIAGIYTAAGGLRAVVFTDILQAVIILLGSSILLFSILGQFDYSWDKAVASIPAQNMSVIQPADDETLPWVGTLFGIPILGFYFWCTTQFISQRILGARDLDNARWGALLGGALKLPVIFLMVMPGVFAMSIFPDIQVSDMVFAELIIRLLPVGVVGIVLAGLIAAIMSSLDSALNSSSTLIVMDFIQPSRPELSTKQIVRYGQITTLILMVFASLWAPFIANFDGIFQYLQQVLSFLVPPIATVFLLGLWSRGNAQGAKATLVGGHLICFGTFIFYINEFTFGLHFTVLAGLLTMVCFCIYIVVSLSTEPPAMENIKDLTWKYRLKEEGKLHPIYLDYRFISGVLVFLTLLLVFFFW